MNLRGIQKFSLIDYPGKMSCIVFVGNCNCRCPYCHNPCLVFDPESQPIIEEKELFEFLERRKGKLDGVVISGGEPSLRAELGTFASKIKEMGFLVKVDTNGSNPEIIIDYIQNHWIDALGVDYKAPARLYNRISGTDLKDFSQRVQKLIKYAVDSKIFIDVRTTVHKSLLSIDDLREMRKELDSLGHKKWFLQQFHPVEIIDDNLIKAPTYSDAELIELAKSLGNTYVRGLKGVVVN